MNNKIRALAVGMLSTLGLTFAGGAAMAATAPTLLAKVGTTAATTFSPTSTPLVVSTEDVDSDDSAGCIVEFDNFTGDYTAADYSQLTDVGGANPTKFSEFTKTFTWTESFEALDGKKVAFVFYQAETCDKTDPEAWLGSRGVKGDAEVVFTIDAGAPEVAAPGAPATVTVGTINATNAKVTWTAPTTGGAVTSYVVLVGTTSVGTFGSTVLTANLTGLEPNKSYTVTVKAVNAGGEGTKAATFKTADATKSGKIELAAKVGETVAGSKVTITATGLKPGEDYTMVLYLLRSDPVTLASGKVADNGNLTQEVTLPTIAAGSHSITLTTKYWDMADFGDLDAAYFTVDADGKLTEVTYWDDTIDPDPEVAAPGAPATVTVGTINATNAKVTWTAPTTGGAVTSYVVLVGTTSVGTFGSTVLTANLTGLEPNKSYTVTVKAVNAGGEGTKAATFKTADATKSGKIELAAKVGETVAGTKATITATGLKPGEDYTIVLRSDPVTLASGKVADNGNLTQEVTLPTIAAGDHTITLTSKYWDGSALSSVVYFTVDADGKLTKVTTTAPELAETGLNLILPIGLAAVFAAAGVGFVVNGVRRRATANA